MGWLDSILGKKEEPKKTKKTTAKTGKTTKKEAKTASKPVEKKKENKTTKTEKVSKKDLVLKGPDKPRAKSTTQWTKGKLDKLSTSELHKVAEQHKVNTKGLSKTQIYREIVK